MKNVLSSPLRSPLRSPFILSGTLLPLDQLSVAPAVAYSMRKLKRDYTGNAIRVRRSSDNLETDIGFSTTTQTRTNLAPVPAQSGDSRTVTGITLTTVGTGTEFGQSYIDVRWNGTATASGNLQYGDTILTSTPNTTSSALVTAGETYTCSMGYRLIAGTFPTFTAVRLSPTYRNNASFVSSTNLNLTSNPSATLQRASVTTIAPATANCVQNLLQMTGVTTGFVCDFTLRIYAPNTELGVGNARPLLQRYVAETIANVGELDAEALLAFDSSENRLLHSEAFDNAVWTTSPVLADNVTANSSIAPNNTTTADLCECSSPSSGRAQAVTLSVAGQVTFSTYIKSGGVGDWARIAIFESANSSNQVRCWFNMTTGLLGTVTVGGFGWTSPSATVESVGDGWYRVSITGTCTVTSLVAFVTNANADNDTARTVGQNRLLWGAQFNTEALQPYSPTTTTAQTFNLNTTSFVTTWYDQGRYWNASRRNLVTYSEELENTAWRKLATGLGSAPIVTSNAGLAPNGTMTADRLQFALNGGTASGDQSLLDQVAATTITSQPYVYSFWARTFDASTRTIQLSANGALNVNCTVTPTWQRFSLVYPSALDNNRSIVIRLRGTFATSDSADLLIWGIQQEQSTVLTEYQPILAGTPLNVTQATAGNQPTIVTLGAVVTEKLKPSIKFGASLSLATTAFGTSPQRTINSVNTYSPSSGYQYVWEQNSSGATVGNGFLVNSATFADWVGGDMVAFGDGYNAGRNPRFVSNGRTPSTELDVYTVSLGNQLSRIRVDGANVTSRVSGLANFPASTSAFGISRTSGNQGLVGTVSELIYMDTSLPDTDLQTLERNQGQFYNIAIA